MKKATTSDSVSGDEGKPTFPTHVFSATKLGLIKNELRDFPTDKVDKLISDLQIICGIALLIKKHPTRTDNRIEKEKMIGRMNKVLNDIALIKDNKISVNYFEDHFHLLFDLIHNKVLSSHINNYLRFSSPKTDNSIFTPNLDKEIRYHLLLEDDLDVPSAVNKVLLDYQESIS